jgi:hypothetical protein
MSNLILTKALLLLLVIVTMHAQVSPSGSRIMSQNSTFVVAGDDDHDNVAPSFKRKVRRPIPPSGPNGGTYIPSGPASSLQVPSTKLASLLLTLLFLQLAAAYP